MISPTCTVDCPTLVAPADGVVLEGATSATLVWEAASAAVNYAVYVWPSNEDQPSTPTAIVEGVTYDAVGLIANTEYSWRIIARRECPFVYEDPGAAVLLRAGRLTAVINGNMEKVVPALETLFDNGSDDIIDTVIDLNEHSLVGLIADLSDTAPARQE